MSNLQIELSCPYEVTNSEWLEIVDMINQHICRGNYSTVSAHIVSGLTKRSPDSPFARGIVRAGIRNEDGTISYLDESASR